MAWVWSKLTETDPVESPALRLWVTSKLPADWTPKKVTGDGVTLSEPFKEGETQTMAVDLRSSHATLRFDFEDKQGRSSEMTLAIQVAVARPYILVRPECNKQDLRFMVHKAFAQHLFVGLNCINLGDSFDIYFFRSKDSSWNNSAGLVQFDPEGNFTAFKYHVAKPKDQVVYSQRLFRVGTFDDQRRQTEYSIFYHPKLPPKTFYLNAGLGFTYYSYHEKLPDLSLTQLSTTGKMSFGIRVIPRVLDFAFNGFMTVFALSHKFNIGIPANLVDDNGNPISSVPEARFYGLNGRIGYRLPLDLGATEFMFLTGWYFWGMTVSDNSYGIKTLSGPQLFITMINSQAGHAGWWLYGKFAFISDHLQITTEGNEVAFGGGIELSAHESKPFSLTLDIANAKFDIPGKNGMTLLSVTTGVQKSF